MAFVELIGESEAMREVLVKIEQMMDAAAAAYTALTTDGTDVLLMAADHSLRRELNRRIREDLITVGIVQPGPAVTIADGTRPRALLARHGVAVIFDATANLRADRDRALFEQHLVLCDGCTAYLDQMRRTLALMGRLRDDVLDTPLRGRLLETFRAWKRNGDASTGG